MRIVIVSAPKTGNNWLKCLLAQVYGLTWLKQDERRTVDVDRAVGEPDGFRRFVAVGGYPDGTIFHQHWRYSPALCDAIEATPAQIATIVRDPYDLFVSFYSWVQDLAVHQPGRLATPSRAALADKPLDHPDVLAFLAGGFRGMLIKAQEWLAGGRAVVVRYEALHADPVAELRRATNELTPVAPERIEQSLSSCSTDRMRTLSDKMAWHVRKGAVGESHDRLTEAHLALFREKHADLIQGLGYEVR